MEAAKAHGINLSEIIQTPSDNAFSAKIVDNTNDNLEKSAENQLLKSDDLSVSGSGQVFVSPVPRHDDTYERIKAEQTRVKVNVSPNVKPQRKDDGFAEFAINTPRSHVPKTVFVSLGFMALLVAAVIGILIPKQGNRIIDQEDLVFAANEQGQPKNADESMFKGLVPEDWNQQLENLKGQAAETAQNVGETVQAVQEDLMGENAGTATQRLEKVSQYAENIVGQDILGGLSGRFNEMRSSMGGQEYIDQSMSALHGMVMGGGTAETLSDDQLNAQLDEARQSNSYLGKTFTGVPQQDLKAAAMLLTMTQMRESLNREGVPFEKDMQTLLGMVGKDDVALRAALDRLAPSAKDGILTPAGLSKEFRTIAGDAVSAGLNGEDVSIVEKARARMNEVFQVEKGGELVSGTKAQAVVAKAQKEIDAGNIETAVRYLKDQLRADELEPLRPWIDRAEAAMSAPSVRKAIENAMQMQSVGGSTDGGSKMLKKTTSEN